MDRNSGMSGCLSFPNAMIVSMYGHGFLNVGILE